MKIKFGNINGAAAATVGRAAMSAATVSAIVMTAATLSMAICCACGRHDSEPAGRHMLDRLLTADYTTPRQARIDSIRDADSNSAPEELWRKSYDLAQAYADFNVDSVLYYIRKAERETLDETSRRRVLLRKASIYNGSLMMYKEATDIFNQLAVANQSQQSDTATPYDEVFRKDYFTLGVQLYKNLEERAVEAEVKEAYCRKKVALRDSVLSISPEAVLIQANQLIDHGDVESALTLLHKEIATGGYTASNGAVYHVITHAYEQLGNEDKEIEYLILAASADITNGVREYIALPRLAYLLYKRGDVTRAYHYMKRSTDDAQACNARVRLFDMSETMSVISGAHNQKEREARRWLTSFMVLLGLALILAAVSLYYAHRRNKQLQHSREELQRANRELAEAGNIREKYGRQFISLSLEFMDKLNHYRLQLLKIASKRNFEALYDAISSTSAMEKDAEVFYRNFDKSFSQLYPDFIRDFNSLLRDEEQVKEPEGGMLNTELRIFALMKLGVSESGEIAKLLHCSQSTVYNYRTRYRAKAKDKAEFDRRIFGLKPTNTPT